jgi:hypothetical protein
VRFEAVTKLVAAASQPLALPLRFEEEEIDVRYRDGNSFVDISRPLFVTNCSV